MIMLLLLLLVCDNEHRTYDLVSKQKAKQKNNNNIWLT